MIDFRKRNHSLIENNLIEYNQNIIDLQWFAAEDEGRTEKPSELKIEKARKEGRVAKSQELNSAIVMLFAVLTLIFLGKWLLEQFRDIYEYFFTRCTDPNPISGKNAGVFFVFFIKMVFPITFVSLVAGVAGNIIQNKGFLFSTKPIQPNFNKIVPHFGEYLKKTIFSGQGLFNLAKSIIKVAIIIIIAAVIIKRNVVGKSVQTTDGSVTTPGALLMIIHGNGPIEQIFAKIAKVAATLLIVSAVVFLAISIPDYLMQRHEFMESLKMAKQEVKEEYKEMEGDPEVKGRLKEAQQRLLASNMPRAVAESDVVITNPTHFAVALKYDTTIDNSAPQVQAKGADFMAQRIKEVARENDVPIVENRPLARGLYTDTEIGDIIPESYITAIAVIYAQLKKFSK